VLITVSKLDGGQLQVNICRRRLKEGENQALTIPLCVIGTATEIDATFVHQISSFVTSHVGLHTNPT
jgi:PRTRC genetic system protein E